MKIFMLLGIFLGLFVGLLGVPYSNYEIHKCQTIQSHVYDEAYADCYMPLERQNWFIFWNCIGVAIVGMFLLGAIGFIIDEEWGYCY